MLIFSIGFQQRATTGCGVFELFSNNVSLCERYCQPQSILFNKIIFRSINFKIGTINVLTMYLLAFSIATLQKQLLMFSRVANTGWKHKYSILCFRQLVRLCEHTVLRVRFGDASVICCLLSLCSLFRAPILHQLASRRRRRRHRLLRCIMLWFATVVVTPFAWHAPSSISLTTPAQVRQVYQRASWWKI